MWLLVSMMNYMEEGGQRLRSCAPGFSAEVPKGGVEFINFPKVRTLMLIANVVYL